MNKQGLDALKEPLTCIGCGFDYDSKSQTFKNESDLKNIAPPLRALVQRLLGNVADVGEFYVAVKLIEKPALGDIDSFKSFVHEVVKLSADSESKSVQCDMWTDFLRRSAFDND